MRFWKTLNALLRSRQLPELDYGEARGWYEQYRGWRDNNTAAAAS